MEKPFERIDDELSDTALMNELFDINSPANWKTYIEMKEALDVTVRQNIICKKAFDVLEKDREDHRSPVESAQNTGFSGS